MAKQLTHQDLLDAVDRAIPEDYLDPMKVTGDGYELVHAHAAVGERVSLAIRRFEEDGFILSAQGPRQATVIATFYRETAAAGAGRVLVGTRVLASRGGQMFRTTEDAVFGALDLEVSVPAIAAGYGYEWNIKGPFVDPQGVTWPGDLDTIDRPLMEPMFWDRSMRVRNDADADGLGRPATLDMIGGERDRPRYANETDAHYRTRIRAIPDAVSPNAIRAAVREFLRPYGIGWYLVETWEHAYQECYDAPDDGPTPFEPYDANLCCYDDPRPSTPIRNRYLGEQDYSGAFILEIAPPAAIEDQAFAFDAPTEPAIAELALPAFDVPENLSEPAIKPAFDGRDFVAEQLLGDLATMLDEIAAAGVYWIVIMQEQEP